MLIVKIASAATAAGAVCFLVYRRLSEKLTKRQPQCGDVGEILRSRAGAHARSLQSRPGADPRYGVSTRDNTPLPPIGAYGVSYVVPGCGILPRKVHTVAEAVERLRCDGAVILTGLQTHLDGLEAYRDAAEALPMQLFGKQLLASAPPVSVGVPGKDNADELRAFYAKHWGRPVVAIPPWEPNCCHTDGEAYGDHFPPYFFLLFAHTCDGGGENAIVSSRYVVETMERDPQLADLARRLRTVPVDQTQYGANGANGVPCVSPIVQELPGGRLMVKMATRGQRPASGAQKREAKTMAGAALVGTAARAAWDEADDPSRDQEMIDAYKDAMFAATQHAPRFKMLPGEALLVDNYETLHVREPYVDLQRRSWRVWCWAEGACYGAPDFMRKPTNARPVSMGEPKKGGASACAAGPPQMAVGNGVLWG